MEKFFVNHPVFAMVISIVIVLLGYISIHTLPIEQYPDITPPVVEVNASYQGADAVTVDEAVATPIAQSIMGVSDMLYLQTTSSNDGQMSLQVTFDIGSDPDMDAIFTQNNVASTTAMLPASVNTQGVTTRKSMSGFLLVYSLYSDGRYDDNFLSNYAFINIQNELLKINGVGKVEIMGAGEYSMRIWIRPDMLHYHDISISNIQTAIESQSGVYPAGQLGAEPSAAATDFTYTVTMPPQINTAEEYENIIVKILSDGSSIRLKDVARVELGSQSYGVSSNFNGRPSAIIVVYQSPGSNAMKVGAAVKQTLARLSERFVDGIDYATVVDTTASIRAGIEEILWTLLLALGLVILIIYLFIQDVRAMIIPLVAIPVSLIGTFMLFPLLDFSVNIISLLGLILAIGLVVDDAIVVVEAVQVNIEKGMSPKAATIEAMKAVAPPIIATTLVLISVFIPVSFIGGISGRLYQQFSVTIVVSVIFSTFNALTLSPALCALLLKPRKPKTEGFFGAFNRWFGRRVEGYLKVSSILERHAIRSLLFIAILAAGIFGMSRLLPGGFLPEEDQGYLMVAVNLPDAASLSRTQEVMQQIQTIITSRKDVQYTAAAAGFNMLAGIASTNCGTLFVTLKDYKDRSLSSMQIADQLNQELYASVNSGTAYAFGPPSIPGLGIASGLSLMVQDRGGNTVDYLARHTDSLIRALQALPELASVSSQFNNGIPQRHLLVDREYALREGVSLDELHRLITTFLGGSYINNFNRFGKLYQTYIQAESAYRQDKQDLNSYFVTNGNGNSVPISSFITVQDTTGVEYISQFNLYRSIALTASANRGYSSAQAMAAVEQTANEILPDDMDIAWSGISYQESTAASGSNMAYVYALVFVFLCLAALYESWALPLTILLGVPFAVFGAMLFVLAAHLINPAYVNNLFMQISLIMLIGLSAKNAILIIEYANRLFFEQGQSLSDAALGAARLRLRPIIMTAFAFILGVVPLIFASGAYSAARNVMGVALVGGMLIATLLGVFIYPALYVLIGKMARFERIRDHKTKEAQS